MPKHRTPPRVKSGPNKGRFRKRRGGSRRRRNSPGKVFSGPVYRPRIRARKARHARKAQAFRKSSLQRARLGIHTAYFNPPRRRRRRNPRRSKMTGYSADAGTYSGWVAAKPARRKARRSAKRARLKKHLRAALKYANPRRRRRRHAKRHSNPRRRRRHARRHSNPRRRRRHANPGFLSTKVLGPTFTIPVLNLKVAPLEMAFDGAGIAAGASLAIFVPQQAVQLVGPQYAWLNQGWYGVGASALTTLGVAAVGKLASPKVAKLLGLGGALATVLRAAAQLAPVQVRQYVTGPLASPDNFPVYAGAGPVVGKSGGMGGFLTADQIIANEMQPGSDRSGSLRDWVGSGQGMRDWVTSGAGSVMDGSGGESF